MKKVWILEQFQPHERLVENYNNLIGIMEQWEKAEVKEENKAKMMGYIEQVKKTADENPNGMWYAVDGKVIYDQFCRVARATIRDYPDDEYRVVEGLVDDGAKYWINYKAVRVNDGVLRYLLATKNQ